MSCFLHSVKHCSLTWFLQPLQVPEKQQANGAPGKGVARQPSMRGGGPVLHRLGPVRPGPRWTRDGLLTSRLPAMNISVWFLNVCKRVLACQMVKLDRHAPSPSCRMNPWPAKPCSSFEPTRKASPKRWWIAT